MVDVEKYSFQLISAAGDSFSTMMLALQEMKNGNVEKSDTLMEKAKETLLQAHQVQTELIVQEAQGDKLEYSTLLVHAQDHLMNTVLAETLIKEIIDLHKENKREEEV